MKRSAETKFRDIISGRARGVGPSLTRAALSVAKIPYAGAISFRNSLYDRQSLQSHKIDRPIICIGNITTGGTGKTPMVQWLANHLRTAGLHPAVLMRGYKRDADGSDEQRLLLRLLDHTIPIEANADRVAGAHAIVRHHPEVHVILLDDGFQHRRLHRDFDLVLIDATNPFGHDQLLPRGLLREPISGLVRASAIVITHVEAATKDEVAQIEARIRSANSIAPIYRASHQLIAGRIAGQKVFAFSGIGNPEAFERQLPAIVGSHRFADHHAYTEADIAMVRTAARSAGAGVLVTTEKDWTKLEKLVGDGTPKIVPVGLEVRFDADHESRLFEQILRVIRQS